MTLKNIGLGLQKNDYKAVCKQYVKSLGRQLAWPMGLSFVDNQFLEQ